MKITTGRLEPQKVAALCRWLIAHPKAVKVRNIDGRILQQNNFAAVLDLAESSHAFYQHSKMAFDTTIEGDEDTLVWLKMMFL